MKKLILAASMLALSAGFSAAETVRIGTEGAYEPWNFLNDKGEVDGFERELGDELCKRAELTCEWVTNDWDSIIPNLVSGNYDMIMAGMSITDERKQVIAFTQNYTPPDPSSYVGKKGADIDVNKAVIAAQTGTIQAAYIADSEATLVEFATPEETIAAVKNGEADAVLADKSFLDTFVEEDGELVFVGEGGVALGDGVGVGLRQSDNELREKLDAVISAMKEDGTLNTMIEKWKVSGTF